MKSDSLFRQIIVPFTIAVLVYIVFYTVIEHLRTKNGPWRVTFTSDTFHEAALLIDQPASGITNAGVVFKDQTLPANFSGKVLTFEQPKPVPYDVPFGKCIFMDTTFLPGTLVLEAFGHEVQLLPRTLLIDRKEQGWHSGTTLLISGTNVVSIGTRN
jgi:hypothetical protein